MDPKPAETPVAAAPSVVESSDVLDIDEADLAVPKDTVRILDLLSSATSSRKGRLKYLTGLSSLAQLPAEIGN